MPWDARAATEARLGVVFRELDPNLIRATAEALSKRIHTDFPNSGLWRISRELSQLTDETRRRVDQLRRPDWLLRIGVWTGTLLMLVAVIAVPVFISVRTEVEGITDLLQGIEAAVNNAIFIAVALWFVLTIEQVPKRRAALQALHELRSIAHIIDMHQLTKAPDHSFLRQSATVAELLPSEKMGRYLDYCSELLSIVSKLAALYAQYLIDQRVLDAVNDVETLTDGLSSKIWQKIMILDTVGGPQGTRGTK